jgi:hypothetical protein
MLWMMRLVRFCLSTELAAVRSNGDEAGSFPFVVSRVDDTIHRILGKAAVVLSRG